MNKTNNTANSDLVTLDKCLSCESNKLVGLLIRSENDVHASGFGLNESPKWCVCSSCGFIFQNPRQPIEVVENFYKHSSFRDHDPAEIQGTLDFSPHQLVRFDPWLRVCGFDLREIQNGNCLDYGCGFGGALSFFTHQGNTNYGVEIDEFCIQVGQQNFPISILPRLNELPENINFDFMFSHHAVEHVYDPNEFFEFASKRLKKSGYMVLAFPAWRYANVMSAFNAFGASDLSVWDHIALGNILNKHGFYLASYLYQNYGVGGDWEIIGVAIPSERKNHFSFNLDECLEELYFNIRARSQVTEGEKPRNEQISAIFGRPIV